MNKLRTWHDNWNQVIRSVIFPDTTLLSLMLIPTAERTDIRSFLSYRIYISKLDLIKRFFARLPPERILC